MEHSSPYQTSKNTLTASMTSSFCSLPSEFLQALVQAIDSNSLLDTQNLPQTWKSSQSSMNPTVSELASILAHASERNRPDIVRFLLQEGAMVNSALVNRLASNNVSTDIWEVFVEMGFMLAHLRIMRARPLHHP